MLPLSVPFARGAPRGLVHREHPSYLSTRVFCSYSTFNASASSRPADDPLEHLRLPWQSSIHADDLPLDITPKRRRPSPSRPSASNGVSPPSRPPPCSAPVLVHREALGHQALPHRSRSFLKREGVLHRALAGSSSVPPALELLYDRGRSTVGQCRPTWVVTTVSSPHDRCPAASLFGHRARALRGSGFPSHALAAVGARHEAAPSKNRRPRSPADRSRRDLGAAAWWDRARVRPPLQPPCTITSSTPHSATGLA